MQDGRAACDDGLAHQRRQRIDAAAFQSGFGDHGFAAHLLVTERKVQPLQRVAGKAGLENIRPGDEKTAVRRPQRYDANTGLAHCAYPQAVGAQVRPARAAQRQNGCIGADLCRTFRRIEQMAAFCIPAHPPVAQLEANAGRIEAPEPGAQQRRCFHRPRKHPPARTDERLLAQLLAPGAQGIRRKGVDGGAQMRRGCAVARKKSVEIFAVREIEPAAPCEQELAANRRHALVDGDGCAATGGNLGCHQAGRATTNDGDFFRQSVRHRY